jgi:Dyp-type peroxidase family
MSDQQQPPFMICVPIAHGAGWPGLAAREVDAQLDLLGNPAGEALQKALDAIKVIHYLSMAVVWDEGNPDPPMLVVHVAADSKPKTVAATLADSPAGDLLLPVFQAAAGVNSRPALRALLERGWVKPVAEALPLSRRRATGLPFQGTPGLTVRQILEDAKIAKTATAAVLSHMPQGRSAALSYLDAAQRATAMKPTPGKSAFSYSEDVPPLSLAGVQAQAATILSLIVFDWAFLFVMLLASAYLNLQDLLGPMLSGSSGNSGEMIYAFPLALLFGIILNEIIKLIKRFDPKGFSRDQLHWLAVATFIPIFFAICSAVGVSTWLSGILAPPKHFHPFAWWLAGILGLLAVVLLLAVIAGLLLWRLRFQEDRDEPDDADPDPARLTGIIRREDHAEYRQNHIIAVSTLSPGCFRRYVFLPAALYAASLMVRAGVFRTGFLSGIGTIHFIQWARIPRTGKLVFTGDYDGSWQSYLEDAVTLLPGGATGIWSNAIGFPKTRWLFSDGATDGDRFKRWVRRQMIPTRFWYSAYPKLTTVAIRRNAAIRLGLEAPTMTASQAETWLKLFGSAPRPASEIETGQIQGLALSGYRNLREGALLAVSFPIKSTDCRAWLASVGGRVDFGDGGQSRSAMAVALSARGLERLGRGAAGSLAAQFSPAFAMGMANEARANILGDVGRNAPGEWKWGGPDDPIDAVMLIYASNPTTLRKRLMEEVAACTQNGITLKRSIRLRRWPRSGSPITEPFGFVDGISQPSIRGLLSSRGALKVDLLEPGEFILGYPDGRQAFPPTPQVFATDDPAKLLPDLPANFPPPPSNGAVRDVGRNGSYLVIRQLEQDVAGYDNYVNTAAATLETTRDWVAAKMVGRWPNGAPLVLFPYGEPKTYNPLRKDEDFLFGRDDPQGVACPFGAHIRRANPRDQFDAGDKTQMSITNRHRILRRGRSYVDWFDSRADAQGLLFMCLNADIERQFEFLQQTWIGSTSFGPLSGEADPLTGMNRTRGTYTIPTTDGPRQLTGMPSFVSVIGGGYFFLPGRQALSYLSR